MSITSFYFLIFIAIVAVIYWYLTAKAQWVWLLLASITFYCVNIKWYTFLYLIANVGTVYIATRLFETASYKKKRAILIVTLVINVAILAVLKYSTLAIGTVNLLFGTNFEKLGLVSSLAISFYLLSLLSYLLDAYWGVVEVEKNPLKLLLFTIFFPLMTSGPIHKHSELAGELFAEHRFDYEEVSNGLKRVAYGLFKKLVIANRLSIIVATVFDDYYLYTGVCLWIAAMLFLLELYIDFSGCMDIVIGVSMCFGIKLKENFRSPFFSKTIQEFWQRWHITLGTWLRDYVMNPILKTDAFVNLGKKCKKRFGKKIGKKIPSFIAMFVLWSLMGLWHGDGWKYIVGEGWWFWAVIVISQLLDIKVHEGKLWNLLQRVRTYLIATVGLWFFRAESLREAINMMRYSFGFSGTKDKLMFWLDASKGSIGGYSGILTMIIGILVVWKVDRDVYYNEDVVVKWNGMNPVVRYFVYIVGGCLIMASLSMGSTGFVYQQF